MTNTKNNIFDNPMYFNSSVELLERAHSLRLSETECENLLWQKLRNRKLNGLKFRRQHAIIGFVADFYCHEARLIIEVDGNVHQNPVQKQRDEDRTFELERLGLRVIRISNEEIKSNINKVLNKIVETINNNHLTPIPSADGEGRCGTQINPTVPRGEVTMNEVKQ